MSVYRHNRVTLEDRFGSWLSELNLKLNTSQLIEVVDEHRICGKLFSNLMARLKTKKHAQKSVNYCTLLKLDNERSQNNEQFTKLGQILSESAHLDQSKKIDMYRKLFLLVTTSKIYKELRKCERLDSEPECTTKISALLEMAKKYVKDIDSVEHLAETDIEFNKYYFKLMASENPCSNTFEEVTCKIQTTMQQICACLDRILQAQFVQSGKHAEDTLSTTTMNHSSQMRLFSSATSDTLTLQSLLKNWTCLYKRENEK